MKHLSQLTLLDENHAGELMVKMRCRKAGPKERWSSCAVLVTTFGEIRMLLGQLEVNQKANQNAESSSRQSMLLKKITNVPRWALQPPKHWQTIEDYGEATFR